jgi:hypothetical protein
MSRTNHALRGVRGQARRDYHAQIEEKMNGFLAEDSAAFDDGSFLGGKYRASASIPSLPDAAMSALDGMLEAHGLGSVLKSLRELCDGRGSTGAPLESFEAEEGSDEWEVKADALESLLIKLPRDA